MSLLPRTDLQLLPLTLGKNVLNLRRVEHEHILPPHPKHIPTIDLSGPRPTAWRFRDADFGEVAGSKLGVVVEGEGAGEVVDGKEGGVGRPWWPGAAGLVVEIQKSGVL